MDGIVGEGLALVVERKKLEGASKEGQHMVFEGLKGQNRGGPSFVEVVKGD